MQVIKPVHGVYSKNDVSIFLAGSIEMGSAEKWQDKVINNFRSDSRNITFYNPRRDDWDSSWEQRIDNPNFNYQVNWELNHLEKSDIVFFYFDPKTQSPISLLELGKMSVWDKDKLVVCCPEGFWRKGNVEIICERENIILHTNLSKAIDSLYTKINKLTI